MKERIIVWTLPLTAATVADWRSSGGRRELNPLGRPAVQWSLYAAAVVGAVKVRKPELLLIPTAAHAAAAIHNQVSPQRSAGRP